jgi:hypothetical protein
MEEKERFQQMVSLREQVATNSRLRLELLAAVSRILRDHNVNVSDEVLSYLTVADIQELASRFRPGAIPPLADPMSTPGKEKPASEPPAKESPKEPGK